MVERLKHIKPKVWQQVSEKYNIYDIVIFGSILTQDFHEESDIDIALIAHEKLTLSEKLKVELYFEEHLNRTIDVVDLKDDNLDIFLKINILNEGISVYTTDEHKTLFETMELVDDYYRKNESFFKKRRKELLE